MSLSHGILGFLSYGEMSGYDLSKAFSASVQFFWNAQNSQIYMELAKLEKKGMVTHEQVIQEGKPNKKLYSVTEQGKEEFMSWLCDSNELATASFKNAFLMKIFFAGNISPKQSINMLKKFISDCNLFIASMNGVPESIDEYSKEVSEYAALYWQFTAEFGYSYLKMCIEWAQKCIEKLEGLEDVS